ncbi:MAG: hypothetical protein JW719_11780 [Pirellulales bacterium]|nr:hypothetical protein [Pirellulales bacterium]
MTYRRAIFIAVAAICTAAVAVAWIKSVRPPEPRAACRGDFSSPTACNFPGDNVGQAALDGTNDHGGGSPNRRDSVGHDPTYARHLAELKKKIPPEGFTVVVQPPFVVIGDESPEMVHRRATETVQWAVDLLKKSYFKKDPDEILDIWLFKDKASYERHARSIFGTRPSTPYGYYSAADRALVMNIATGGGTLVHEIVHPFMRSNFPECPAWFNEGLGSLYEQASQRGGRIVGLTNWRLAGLQEAIRRKRVPSFKTLCSTSTRQFYDEDPGTNYAQARYLCYYLQEKGLLETFYHRFRRQHAADPTGYRTLQEVLDRDDLEAFQKDWEAFVLGLRFP